MEMRRQNRLKLLVFQGFQPVFRRIYHSTSLPSRIEERKSEKTGGRKSRETGKIGKDMEEKAVQTEQATRGNNGEKMELCVLCKGETGVPVSLPVSQRRCYVPGAGQLCEKCCYRLYGTVDLRNLPE